MKRNDPEEEDPDELLNGTNTTAQNPSKKRKHEYKGLSQIHNKENDGKSKESKMQSWRQEDLLKLVERIDITIPQNDLLSYNSRTEMIDWESVAFNNFSSSDCKNMWTQLHKRVRKHRYLREIVEDVKVNIKKKEKITTKTLRHPEKPKQPHNAYLLFCIDERSKVEKQFPNEKNVTVRLGQLFKNLPIEKRQTYEELATKAKDVYNKQLQEFYIKYPECAPQPRSHKRRKSSFNEEGNAPGKPKMAFDIFFSLEWESLENTTDLTQSAFRQQCREKWKDMPKEDKFFWINWADEEYKKYVHDINSYLQNNPEYKSEPLKPTILTKDEQKIQQYCSGKPKQPPLTPYYLFAKLMLLSDEGKAIPKTDTMRYVSMQWRSFSEEEKNEYKTRVEQMWQQYHVDYEAYIKSVSVEQREELYKTESLPKKPKPVNKDNEELTDNADPVSILGGTRLDPPKAPPRTVYKYYKEKYTGSLDPLVSWKKVNFDKREKMRAQLTELKHKYIVQYEAYLKSLTPEELEQFAKKNQTNSVTSSDTDTSASCCYSSDESDSE